MRQFARDLAPALIVTVLLGVGLVLLYWAVVTINGGNC